MLFTKWNELSLNTRVQLSTVFGFSKIGPTHVFDNRIQSDGFRFQDVERAITVETMQNYTQSKETDFDVLWKLAVDKVEGREVVEEKIEGNFVAQVEVKGFKEVVASKGDANVVITPRKRGRPSKK